MEIWGVGREERKQGRREEGKEESIREERENDSLNTQHHPPALSICSRTC
jgi:hypothetical protein